MGLIRLGDVAGAVLSRDDDGVARGRAWLSASRPCCSGSSYRPPPCGWRGATSAGRRGGFHRSPEHTHEPVTAARITSVPGSRARRWRAARRLQGGARRGDSHHWPAVGCCRRVGHRSGRECSGRERAGGRLGGGYIRRAERGRDAGDGWHAGHERDARHERNDRRHDGEDADPHARDAGCRRRQHEGHAPDAPADGGEHARADDRPEPVSRRRVLQHIAGAVEALIDGIAVLGAADADRGDSARGPFGLRGAPRRVRPRSPPVRRLRPTQSGLYDGV